MGTAERYSRVDVLATALILLCLIITRTVLRFTTWSDRTGGLPLPPGPRSLPFVGNLLDMPKSQPWRGFRDLCLKYGDMTYLQVMGRRVVVLGNAAVISELLDKRASNTSDRLVTPIVHLAGLDRVIGFIPYGPVWRAYRRALWQHFRSGVMHQYYPVQRAIVRKFLVKLYHEPRDFKMHIRFAVAATILKISYGIDIQDVDHDIIRMIEAVLEGSAQALVPGKYLVDTFPLLQYVPSWFPGAGFQRTFATWRWELLRMKDLLFETRNTAYTDEVLPNTVTPIVDALMSQCSNTPANVTHEVLVKDVVAIIFLAGTDTTSSTAFSTVIALALHPKVQKKAQTELDSVIGRDRLPDLTDRDDLVYVQAVIMEALRWYNVTPLGIPHRTIEDDEIRGYFVPAGTTLIPNIWACMQDAEEYPNPNEFRPERFIRDGKIDTSVRDPSTIVFGAGRRICPGRYFAKDMLFLTIASLLHVFNIGPPSTIAGNQSRYTLR